MSHLPSYAFSRAFAVAVACVLLVWAHPAAANSPIYKGTADDANGTGMLPGRFAVVIGIDNYLDEGSLYLKQLAAASQDAKEVAEELREAGFSVSLLRTTSSKRYVRRYEILNAVYGALKLAGMNENATGRKPVFALYFAGHGLQYEGIDYVVPSDFAPSIASDIDEMAISIPDLLQRINWVDPAPKIVIIDACRNDIAMKIPESFDGAVIALRPGSHLASSLTSSSQGSPSTASARDAYFLYATISGDVAKEDAATENGRFTESFVSRLRELRETTISKNSGRDSNVDALANMIISDVTYRSPYDTPSQMPTVHDSSPRFDIFSTELDFKNERSSFEYMLKLKSVAGMPDALADDVLDAMACNAFDFLRLYTEYSYYSDAARRWITAARGRTATPRPPTCGRKPLQVNSPVVPLDETSVNGSAPTYPGSTINGSYGLTDTTKLLAGGRLIQKYEVAMQSHKAGMLASNFDGRSNERTLDMKEPVDREFLSFASDAALPEPTPELKGALVTAPIRSLAVMSVRSPLRSTPHIRGRVTAQAQPNELVIVLSSDASGWTRIRRQDGNEGFVESRRINPGRAAVKFSVQDFDSNHRPTMPPELHGFLRASVVTDFSVLYPAKEGNLGFLRAHATAFELLRRLPSDSPYPQSFLPNVGSWTTAEGDSDYIPPGSVVVTMAVLSLDDKVRSIIGYSTRNSMQISDAIDLKTLVKLRNDEELAFGVSKIPAWYQDTLGIGADVLMSLPSEGESGSADSCVAEAFVATGGRAANGPLPAEGAYSVFVQVASAGELNRFDRLRQALKFGGYQVPDAQIVAAVPRVSSVRYCGESAKEEANTVARILRACGIEELSIEASRCSTNSNKLEIYLADRPFSL